MIFGEDLFAPVNAFVRHSTDFSELAGPRTACPSIAPIKLVKQPGKVDVEYFTERGCS